MDDRRDETRVVKEEAVGMYDVVVLQAGSSQALSRWMDENEYRYPTGMDQACDDYIDEGWCFVAVRARIGHKNLVDPRPGQVAVDENLQAGASFDGHVQAMGFRFRAPELVVPMRLSTFNEGDLRNVVYVLAESPLAIDEVSQDLVVRQISGPDLYRNLTSSLPLRILGGKAADIPRMQRQVLRGQRDPLQHMQAAIDLFRGDLRCAINNRLSNREEVLEKHYLVISERLGLRGEAIDALHREATIDREAVASAAILKEIQGMTMTVIDGDFPRDVLANQNLKFSSYRMPGHRNSSKHYHATEHGPFTPPQGSVRIEEDLAALFPAGAGRHDQHATLMDGTHALDPPDRNTSRTQSLIVALGVSGALILLVILKRTVAIARPLRPVINALLALVGISLLWMGLSWIGASGKRSLAQESGVATRLMQELSDPKQAPQTADRIISQGNRAVPALHDVIRHGSDMAKGWAVVSLQEIGTPAAKQTLEQFAQSERQSPLVKAWIDAARIGATESIDELLNWAVSNGISAELQRPFQLRLQNFQALDDAAAVENLMVLVQKKPETQPFLSQVILSVPPSSLARICYRSRSTETRRTAAAYLATQELQGDASVGAAIAKALRFNPDSDKVAWQGGPLFLPQLQWSRRDSIDVYLELTKWWLWADLHGHKSVSRQILNNMMSLSGRMQLIDTPASGHSALRALLHEIELPQLVEIVRNAGMHVDAQLGKSATGRELPRAFVFNGSVSQGAQAHLGWLVETSDGRSLVAGLGSDQLATRWLPSKFVFPTDQPDRLRQLASVEGKFSELLHQINAPNDVGSYGLFSETGYYSSSDEYAGYKELKPGYWVYVYPTWYVWKDVNKP